MFFSNTHCPQLIIPFYSIFLQPPFSKISALSLHFNAWWVWRTPDRRSETIPSSRISPDPSDSQLLLFSSPHSFSTGFRSGNWDGHSRSLVLCSVVHFCFDFDVCLWIIVLLEDPTTAHCKISSMDSQFLIFYLLVVDRILDAMMPTRYPGSLAEK